MSKSAFEKDYNVKTLYNGKLMYLVFAVMIFSSLSYIFYKDLRSQIEDAKITSKTFRDTLDMAKELKNYEGLVRILENAKLIKNSNLSSNVKYAVLHLRRSEDIYLISKKLKVYLNVDIKDISTNQFLAIRVEKEGAKLVFSGAGVDESVYNFSLIAIIIISLIAGLVIPRAINGMFFWIINFSLKHHPKYYKHYEYIYEGLFKSCLTKDRKSKVNKKIYKVSRYSDYFDYYILNKKLESKS